MPQPKNDAALVTDVRAKIEALNESLKEASSAGLYVEIREQQFRTMGMPVPEVWVYLERIARPL